MWKPTAVFYPLILLALIIVTEARTRGGSYRGYRGYRGGRYSGSSVGSTSDGAVIAAIVIGSLFGVALLVLSVSGSTGMGRTVTILVLISLLKAFETEAFLFDFQPFHQSNRPEHKCNPDSFTDCLREFSLNYSLQYYNSSYPEPIRQTSDFCSASEECVSKKCYTSEEACNDYELPRTYIAYHLNGGSITMDGHLDDQAWKEVPWTESFLDVRGEEYPRPYYDTKVKVRWDDSRLYVAARLEETNFWGTLTQDESLVWTENAFEVFVVPDGSMHNYKEIEISVRNVTWDLRMKKPYLDAPPCTDTQLLADSPWTSRMEKKTYTDGNINNPNGTGTFWSVEMAFPFDALAEYTNRQSSSPSVNEVWFMLFTRPEYKFKIENGQYTKDETATTSFWAWNPTHAVNYHLPNRYGLVQFKRNLQDKSFYFDKWHIYKALFQTFDAMHKFKVLNGMFTDDLQLIQAPPYVTLNVCANVTVVSANGTDFEVTARSKYSGVTQTGHIRTDRYVWFSS